MRRRDWIRMEATCESDKRRRSEIVGFSAHKEGNHRVQPIKLVRDSSPIVNNCRN